MIVSCPKCGFSQPEDQYCANCGVDMKSYTPPKPPLLPRIIRHPLFPVVVISIIGLLYYTYAQRAEERELQARMEYLSGANDPSPQADLNNSLEAESADSRQESNTASLAAEQGSNTPPETAARPNSQANGNSGFRFSRGQPTKETDTEAEGFLSEDLDVATQEKEEGALSRLSVIYTEVMSDYLESLIGSARQQGQYNSMGDYSTGHLRNLNQLITDGVQSGRIRVITRKIISMDEPRATDQWFSGTQDPVNGQEIGVTTLLALSLGQDQNILGEVEVLISLPDLRDPSRVQREPFISEFYVFPEQGFFMSGMIPNRVPTENEEALYSKGVLEILLSEPFQRQNSELVLFVVKDTAPRASN